MKKTLISIVAPVYNEADGIGWFHDSLVNVLKKINYAFEIIYINDGSIDETLTKLKSLTLTSSSISVKVVDFSRNFGKEAALSAGIKLSTGAAVLTIDSDGQHPVNRIADFIKSWEKGNEVVVGVRKSNKKEGVIKRYGSRLFYSIFNRATEGNLVPGSTDFRIMDRKVVNEFNQLTERNRITRGLIDWLGFNREYINFDANERHYGQAGYTFKKLVELAINTFVSLSVVPLFISGYIGLSFTLIGLILGIVVFIEQVIAGDPYGWGFSGSAMLGILITFLVGLVLSAQGLIGLYLSRLFSEGQRRPLYIIRAVIDKD